MNTMETASSAAATIVASPPTLTQRGFFNSYYGGKNKKNMKSHAPAITCIRHDSPARSSNHAHRSCHTATVCYPSYRYPTQPRLQANPILALPISSIFPSVSPLCFCFCFALPLCFCSNDAVCSYERQRRGCCQPPERGPSSPQFQRLRHQHQEAQERRPQAHHHHGGATIAATCRRRCGIRNRNRQGVQVAGQHGHARVSRRFVNCLLIL